ncbi:MAG: hypothetical protein VKK04_04065 [Synechococcales bacterium]|nr:hypothetical protein [Synechococcales bacterium]
MLIPEIISESALQPFKVYQEGQILQAILYRFTVYRLASRFGAYRRSEAFELAWRFSEEGYPTLVSMKAELGQSIYSVWVDIRHTLAHSPCNLPPTADFALMN